MHYWQLLAVMLAIPPTDQAAKWVLRRVLAGRRFTLGRLGCLQLSEATIWLARSRESPRTLRLWVIWLLAAAGLTVATMGIPIGGGFSGILLGGALSHLIEASVRGSITDFVRLTFWPAFNLADVAIVVGGVGCGAQALLAIA